LSDSIIGHVLAFLIGVTFGSFSIVTLSRHYRHQIAALRSRLAQVQVESDLASAMLQLERRFPNESCGVSVEAFRSGHTKRWGIEWRITPLNAPSARGQSMAKAFRALDALIEIDKGDP
jgi:hypothetical protein